MHLGEAWWQADHAIIIEASTAAGKKQKESKQEPEAQQAALEPRGPSVQARSCSSMIRLV